jgi:prophage regulatory protein
MRRLLRYWIKIIERRLFSEMVEDRLLKIADCLKIIPVAKSTWWQGVKSGHFPQPVKLGSSTFWRYSDLMKFIADTSQSRAA